MNLSKPSIKMMFHKDLQGFPKKGIPNQMAITPLKSIRNEKSWGVLEFWKIKFTINAA